MKRHIDILACVTFAAFAFPAAAQQVTFMTGPQGGSWIPLGGALKGLWEKEVPGLAIQQTPGAGIANVRGVDEGKAQIGFANSATTVKASKAGHRTRRRRRRCARSRTSIRSISRSSR